MLCRLCWLRRWLALSALVLFAATWRLWTPQVLFPQIPFFAALRTVPGWVDWIALTGVVAGLVGLLLAPGERGASALRVRPVPAFAILFVASLTLLVLLDQHRFQVWAYQFAIVAIVLAFVPAPRALSLLRLLTIGIYFWSAVSKLDHTFLHGLGPELLRGTLTAFGLEPGWMRPGAAAVIALAFPLDELVIALLLAFRRTRTLGLIGAIAMHLLLLATLGPFGLNHSAGVLLWNVYFIGQNMLLFAPLASGGCQPAGQAVTARSTSSAVTRRLTPAARLAHWVVYAAVVLPVLEPFGWLDHWPGWAVYAPSAERARVSISQWMTLGSPQLPEHLRPYFTLWVGPSFRSGSRLDLWSLDALSTPIYPDERFHVGVAIAVLDRYGLEHAAWLSVDSRANRFTGARSKKQYFAGQFPGDEQSAFRAYADTFWFNTLPRKIGGW